MDRSRRSFLGLAGVAGLTAALAACGGSLAEPDTGASGFGERASGTLRIWTRSATEAGIRVTIDAFHRSQDRIRVQLTPVLEGQFVTKLATAIRGRDVPDLVDLDVENGLLFIYRDTFTDLTDLIADLPYAKQLSPGHLRLGTNGGRRYAVPYLGDNSVLFYNTQLLDRAGVDPATSLTTFDGILDAADKVRRLGSGTYAWTIPGNGPGNLGFVVQPHIWATGQRDVAGPLSHQTGHITDLSAVRATLEFYRTMWAQGLLPRANYSDAGTAWGADFRAGTIGMFPANYSAAVLAATRAQQARTGVTLLPGPTGGTAFFDGGDNLAIPRGAQNASAAWEFVKFALSVPQQQKLTAGGYSPIRSDAATAAFRRTNPLDVVNLQHLDRGYAPVTLSYNLLFNQPDSPFIAMFRQAVFGGDVDGALETGQSGFDRILTQAET